MREAPGFPYYARPVPGGASPAAEDVAAARARQREIGVPEALEWVHDLVPGLLAVARASGMSVLEAPLLVLGGGEPRRPGPPAGVVVRMLEPGDPALAASNAVGRVGFGHPGTSPGDAGPAERDAIAARESQAALDFTQRADPRRAVRDRRRRGRGRRAGVRQPPAARRRERGRRRGDAAERAPARRLPRS